MVYRNKLTAGELVPTSVREVVFTDTEEHIDSNWHATKPLAFDNKGNIYIALLVLHPMPARTLKNVVRSGFPEVRGWILAPNLKLKREYGDLMPTKLD